MDKVISKYFLQESRCIYPSDYVLNIDVFSKDLPRKVGVGIILYKNGLQIWGKSLVLDSMSELEAGYFGIMLGLEEALEQSIYHIIVIGSCLAISFMSGKYGEHMSETSFQYYSNAMELVKKFSFIRFDKSMCRGKAFEMAKTMMIL